MCGRYVLVKSVELVEKKFRLYVPDDIRGFKSYNVRPGDRVPVQFSDKPQHLDWGHFGWPPRSWLKRMVINATSEKLLNSRMWRPAFNNRRCVIWCNGFYEGPQKEKLSKPYYIYHRTAPVFPLAGIWENSVNEKTGETFRSFAIVTTSPNDMCAAIGHHRSPVVLSSVRKWLDLSGPLSNATEQLMPAFNGTLNAHRVSVEMKSGKENHAGLILPIESPLVKEFEYKFDEIVKPVKRKKGDRASGSLFMNRNTEEE